MARRTEPDPPTGIAPPDELGPDAGLGGLAAGIMAEEDVEPVEDDPAGPSTPVPVPGLRGDAAAGEEPSLGSVVKRYGTFPLAVLTTLNLVDELDRLAFITLGPEIQEAFGLSDAALGAISGLSGLVVVLASVPMGVLADRYRRVPLVGLSALVWAAFAGLTGLVRNVFQLVVARLLSGVGKGSIEPVHTGLLADYYPVEARGRVLGAHRTANPLGQVIGPALAGGVAVLAGGAAGWRWAFYVAVPLTLVPAIASFFLREPKRGAHEESTVDELVGDAGPGPSEDDEDDHPRVPLATAVRRLLEIRSLKYMYSGIGVLGFGLVGAPVLISLYLEEVWGLQELGRGIFFSIGALGPLVGLPFGGKLGDRFYRHDPAWPLFILGVAIPVWTALVVGSLYLPTIWLVAAGWILAGAFLGLAIPAFLQLVAATAPPMFRSLAFSMFGVFLYVFGGFFGPAILGGASDAWGPRTALTLLVVPGVVAGILLVRGARFVHGDIAMVVEDMVERREAMRRRDSDEEGGRNLVEMRNIDFFYGQTQVLFGVDLDVPEGEIVALLGTNGAGKSTVLRVLTGLGHPRRGQIRFRGRDITYLEAEQILGLGIAQMPGGKAVFPDLTVEENLKVGAFTFRKDHDRVERDLEQVYGWFPVLGERRTQRASTLSGGEQQMLALGKAFLTRPELLCIDELSLGLAPTITASLLGIVREMHRRGTTIVIVEQSVNVALALATTAVFMEKGQVRYAGPAEELRRRTDLLRSVFLSGTGEA